MKLKATFWSECSIDQLIVIDNNMKISRIRQAGRYMDTTDVIPFDLLPVGIHWGDKPPLKADRSSLLCMPGTNDPCVVWFIGQVCATWFYDWKKNPQPRVSISIVPWTFGTGTRVRQLLGVLSKPPVGKCFNF